MRMRSLFCNIILVASFLLCGLLIPQGALAQRKAKSSDAVIEEQRRKIAQLEEQIERDEEVLSNIQKQKVSKTKRVESISRQLSDREALLNQTERQIRNLQGDIDNKSRLVDSLEVILSSEKALYAEMVREAYRNYKHNNYLLYLLSSTDFVDGARRIANLRSVAELRQERILLIDSLSRELSTQRAALDERKASLDSELERSKKHRDRLKLDFKTAQKEIQSLTSAERKTMKEKLEAEENLDDAIANLRRLTKGNTEGTSFTSRTSGLKLPLDGGKVTRYKGNMAEISGRKGSRVRSIYDGKVINIRQNKVTGKWDVFIAHGEYITSYSNLEELTVDNNEKVVSNQTIGTVAAGINISTAEVEYKMIFGIYSPNAKEVMKASDCFKRK